MESNTVTKAAQMKSIIKKILFSTLAIIISLLTSLASAATWLIVFKDPVVSELIIQLQAFYIVIVALFIAVAFTYPDILIKLIKIILKLLFGGWVLIFIMISTLDETNKTAMMIIITFIIVYVEVILELWEFMKDTLNFNNKNISISLSIIILSIIHSVLPFVLKEFLINLMS